MNTHTVYTHVQIGCPVGSLVAACTHRTSIEPCDLAREAKIGMIREHRYPVGQVATHYSEGVELLCLPNYLNVRSS